MGDTLSWIADQQREAEIREKKKERARYLKQFGPKSRAEVYKALDSERDYQDSKWGSLDKRNTVGDFLIYMKQELDKAFAKHNADSPEATLEMIRKVTAVGVAAMERHGAPRR